MTPAADALALPRIPPAAGTRHRRRDIVACVLFTAAIAAMGVAAFRPHPAAPESENRALAPWPAPAASREFTAGFEHAFADRFGGRASLLRLHNRLLVRVFGVSTAPNVLIGRDGWLFFLGEEGTSLDRYYRGAPALGDAEIVRIVAELARRARYLASQGIGYVVAIAPDKATIYPEHLPAWAVRRFGASPLARLTDAIHADATVRFVDLRAPVVAAKMRERVYYATDSHWNFLGASIAYREIMRAVADALAPRAIAIAPVVLPPYVPGVDVYRGDLARMTGDPGAFGEPDYAPLGKVLAMPQARCGRREDDGREADLERYACERPGLPRAVVYRDSMAIPLVPMLSENFGHVAYVSSHRLDPAFIARERPDVVIDEMVERAMLAPVATPMPGPAR
jgi:hypothetical protein